MCWRERFLTLRSSLITYTGKEFVYGIIFSLTASPKAAAIQALPASLPSPLPRSPVKRTPRERARGRVLCSCHRASAGPAPNPAALASPCANSPCQKRLRRPQLQTPRLGLCISPMAGGIPGAAERPAQRPGPRCTPRDASCFGSESSADAKSSPWCCPAILPCGAGREASPVSTTAHKASGLQGSFSNAEGKGLIQSETPRKRRPFLL